MSELNMRKRSSLEGDVEGAARIQNQGSGFLILCPESYNNLKGISVRKRRTEDYGRMPLKKMKCSNLSNPTEHRHVPVEVRKEQEGKRWACVDARPAKNQIRSDINNSDTSDPSAILVEDLPVALKKRKASDDGEAFRKKMRSSGKCSSGTSDSCIVVTEGSSQDKPGNICHNFARASHAEVITVSSTMESCIVVKDDSFQENADSISHSSAQASPEDVTVFEMASTANMSRGKLIVLHKITSK